MRNRQEGEKNKKEVFLSKCDNCKVEKKAKMWYNRNETIFAYEWLRVWYCFEGVLEAIPAF